MKHAFSYGKVFPATNKADPSIMLKPALEISYPQMCVMRSLLSAYTLDDTRGASSALVQAGHHIAEETGREKLNTNNHHQHTQHQQGMAVLDIPVLVMQ